MAERIGLLPRFGKCKCVACGKKFIAYFDLWAYRKPKTKGRRGMFCSYHCLRTWEKPQEEACKAIMIEEFTQTEQRSLNTELGHTMRNYSKIYKLTYTDPTDGWNNSHGERKHKHD